MAPVTIIPSDFCVDFVDLSTAHYKHAHIVIIGRVTGHGGYLFKGGHLEGGVVSDLITGGGDYNFAGG